MSFAREKLIRHRIPEQMAARGVICETRVAALGEMPGLLLAKLREEVAELGVEFAKAPPGDNLQRQCEELADVMEVVRCLRDLLGVDEANEIAQERRFDRGLLSYRVVLNLDSLPKEPTT